MAIDDPNVIDFVVQGTDGAAVLIMVEGREWDGSQERLFELQDKVNAYVSFIDSGALYGKYPYLSGKPIRLELRCVGPPDPATAAFIDQVRQRLASEGFSFVVRMIGNTAAG